MRVWTCGIPESRRMRVRALEWSTRQSLHHLLTDVRCLFRCQTLSCWWWNLPSISGHLLFICCFTALIFHLSNRGRQLQRETRFSRDFGETCKASARRNQQLNSNRSAKLELKQLFNTSLQRMDATCNFFFFQISLDRISHYIIVRLLHDDLLFKFCWKW